MMILEGLIAMIWAAAAMGAFAKGIATFDTPATAVVGIVARDMLGSFGGMIAIIGIIVLPITSGDTALRGARLIFADFFRINQKSAKNRLKVSIPIFAVCAVVLIWAKFAPDGFTILWRYFSWANQSISIFAFAIITIYLIGKGHKIAPFMALVPGTWYAFITSSFICNAKIGFNLSMEASYFVGAALAIAYALAVYRKGIKVRRQKLALEEPASYP